MHQYGVRRRGSQKKNYLNMVNIGLDPLCACDNKPARIIIDYKTRYNNMESIYRELASDNLTYRTRSIVSKFVRDRFRPNLNM